MSIATISPDRYNRVARVIHWITALLIVSQFASHFMIDQFAENDPAAGPFKLMHGSGGLLILLLTLFRAFWRYRNPPPPLPISLSRWQQSVAHMTHYGLYALLIAQPVTGMLTAGGYKAFGPVHGLLSLLVLVLVAVHVAAALWHHFVQRDGVLRRML